MLKNILYLLLFGLLLFSCKSNKEGYLKFLNKDSLPSQFIEIDNTKDTAVQTANGAILKIKKGSFSKDKVKLEVKEAYSVEQMVLAGLTTESDGRPLSSGGMIYINSIDEDVKMNEPISVSIPTNYYDDKMQVYKGEEEDGKLNWVDPQPLANNDSLPPYLQKGKILFQQSCASCHALDRDLTGPALSGTENRGPWKDRNKLIAFTKNPAGYMARSCYAQDLKAKYGVMMTAFPQLDANPIYDYIRNEDYKKGFIYYNDFNSACEDSCWRYDSLLSAINGFRNGKDSLIADNGERINFEREYTPIVFDSSDYIIDTFPPIDKVEPLKYQSVYYQFNIKTFDWYNVDHLVDMNGATTELKVETQGNYKDSMSVFIIVPSQRVFAEGGPLTGEENIFGFYTKDGNIALPTGSEVIVFAVGERNGEITFDYKKFTSTDKQTIALEPKVVSKKEFNKTVKRFRIGDASIKADDSKNADQIRKTDQQIKSSEKLIELYRPKNCDCNCGSDTISKLVRDTSSLLETKF